ncbi:GNAT family N-acetyltransferase [Thalassobaculum salexigens]|uniref:GNAT family N-acetyltransferase n=1 Tax=Thalassobaculum salexigens TaxID=455360 RepID=UPI00048BCAFC|nr:GNAT family N-acetyltransferase [Thalassobaculum salexigens]
MSAAQLPPVTWRWHRWDQLDRDQLYAILKARVDIFVVEQECPYPEIDGKDPAAWHLLGYDGHPGDGVLLAYARLFAPGDYFAEPAVGRVLTTPAARGRGVGRLLMAECHRFSEASFGTPAVRLNGQGYLKAFYESLGYAAVMGPYDEDGIPHYEMLRSAP